MKHHIARNILFAIALVFTVGMFLYTPKAHAEIIPECYEPKRMNKPVPVYTTPHNNQPVYGYMTANAFYVDCDQKVNGFCTLTNAPGTQYYGYIKPSDIREIPMRNC